MFIKCKECGSEYNTRFMDKCLCQQNKNPPLTDDEWKPKLKQ